VRALAARGWSVTAQERDVRLPAVDRRGVAELPRQRLGLAEERSLVAQVSGPGDSLQAVEIDLDGERMLPQLPFEPLVVGPRPSVHGEDELEVPGDRLLCVEERSELETEARVLRGAVVQVDIAVEWFRRRRRIDGRRLV